MTFRADDVPPLTDRIAVVTGGNSGVGYATAVVLAARGAQVWLACRDEGKGTAAVARIRATVPDAVVDHVCLDLANLASVRAAAAQIRDHVDRVDLLINNAGVMAVRRQELTADGFELQFGTNHLGHFAFTAELLGPLVAAPAARVVTVSSLAHRQGRIDPEDVPVPRRYAPTDAYARSKLANLLFAFHLDRLFKSHGLPAVSVGVHPGVTRSRITRAWERGKVRTAVVGVTMKLLAQPTPEGALPTLFAATHPSIRGGEYVGPIRWFGTRGSAGLATPKATARDVDVARWLWQRSEELTGVRFDFDAVGLQRQALERHH